MQLYGKSRREAVAFLREVPPPFTLVCCRHLSAESADLQPNAEEPRLDDWLSAGPPLLQVQLVACTEAQECTGIATNAV